MSASSTSPSSQSLDDILKELEEKFGTSSAQTSSASSSKSPKRSSKSTFPLQTILGMFVFVLVAIGGAAGYYLTNYTTQDVRQQAAAPTGGCGTIGQVICDNNDRYICKRSEQDAQVGFWDRDGTCGDPGGVCGNIKCEDYCANPANGGGPGYCNRRLFCNVDDPNPSADKYCDCFPPTTCSDGTKICSGSCSGGGGGGGGGTGDVCSGPGAECVVGQENCGSVGKQSGSGTCSNGGMCCVDKSGVDTPSFGCEIRTSVTGLANPMEVGQLDRINQAVWGMKGIFQYMEYRALDPGQLMIARYDGTDPVVMRQRTEFPTSTIHALAMAPGSGRIRVRVFAKRCPACSTEVACTRTLSTVILADETPTPTFTVTPTFTLTPTLTFTPTPTNTNTPTPTNTSTPVATSTNTPVPTTTPGGVCMSVRVNNLTQNGGEVPIYNDLVSLTCGQIASASHYGFRIIYPNGETVNLDASEAGSNTSTAFSLNQSGVYAAQCRLCSGTTPDTCQEWEELQ